MMNRNGWSDTQLMQAMAAAAACMGDNYNHTCKALRDAGFNCLGSGAYGSAWNRPDMKGYVVKLSSGQGDTYPAYVYWAMANPMACLPEFRHPVFSADRVQFMVMLPRYAECKDELLDSVDYSTASEIVYGYDGRNLIIPKTPLQEAARALREFFGGDVGWDFHRGNLMWDSVTQKYIITDPMCSGQVDELVRKITGKGTESHTITEQVDFEFGLNTGREWPRPQFADRVAEVPLGEGLGQANNRKPTKVGRHTAQMQQFMRNMQGMVMPMEMDWQLGLQTPRQLKARVPDVLGQAAQWVKEQGINPQTAERLGMLAQQYGDDRLKFLGRSSVEFALFPELPQFVRFVDNEQLDKPLPIKHIRVPVNILRTLRDNWKVMAENANQNCWDVRKFQIPKLFDRR